MIPVNENYSNPIVELSVGVGEKKFQRLQEFLCLLNKQWLTGKKKSLLSSRIVISLPVLIHTIHLCCITRGLR